MTDAQFVESFVRSQELESDYFADPAKENYIRWMEARDIYRAELDRRQRSRTTALQLNQTDEEQP